MLLACFVGCGQSPNSMTSSVGSPAPVSLFRLDQQHPRTIRNEDLWSLKVPGTKDIWRLEEADVPGELFTVDRLQRHMSWQQFSSLTADILSELSEAKQVDAVAGQGFVVAGHGREALVNAHDVITSKNTPNSVFPKESAVSIVFFSYLVPELYFPKIVFNDLDVRIQYAFRPFRKDRVVRSQMSPSLVLIPLTTGTRLGHVNVGIQRVGYLGPHNEPYVQPSQRWISKSFSFEVKEK
jgi:hypothetical protein